MNFLSLYYLCPGPILPHMVQGLTRLAASNSKNYNVNMNTLEETVSFSMYQGEENQVNFLIYLRIV